MNDVFIAVALGLLGFCLGSFAGAMVWRLRARQLRADKKAGEHVNVAELRKLEKLTKHTVAQDRSQCLHCGYTLRWYDLIPLVSWISLKGRCRACRKPIGRFEPLIELGVAVFLVASYLLWPYPLESGLEITRLVLWLVSGVGLAILFSYDAKWFLLPDKVNFAVIGLGVITATLTIVTAPQPLNAIASVVGAMGILSGLYLGLYVISKGRWVGFGDIKLGLGLALLLADWQLALVALFLANLIGSLIVIPLLASGKLSRQARVPFGPFLIIGAVLAQLIGAPIMGLYLSTVIL